jgi:hypothetical protein
VAVGPRARAVVLTRARLLEPGDPVWATALERVPHDAYHLPGYADLDARRAGGLARCLLYTDAAGTFLLPLVLRGVPGSDRVDACSPYGYPGPVSDTTDEDFWRRAITAGTDALREAGLVSCFVRLHPLLPAPLAVLRESGGLVQHGHTVSIDLGLGEEELWAQTRANHRRQITRARRDGVVVRTDSAGGWDAFVEIYHQTMTRVGASGYYFFDDDYFTGLRVALGEALHLVSVHEGGPDTPMIGGGLFFEQGPIVQYHLGATRDGFGARQPTKVMFDEVRRWAKARGRSEFHLGGGLGGGADDLFHFKSGFSRRHLPFHTWRLVLDGAGYRELGGDGDPAGFFPAYREGRG